MKLRKGDEVEVISGDDRGKRGKVLRALGEKNRVIVEGVNFIKRHSRPTQANPQGGIVDREAALHASNVMLVDPRSGRPTRIGTRVAEDGTRDRIARRSGEVVAAGGTRRGRGRARKS
ncbi:MAG: 50S ribosomal protein L24 [Gemmatimonadota bacterium]